MADLVTPADLTALESIDAIAEAKAGIIQCLSNLFYVPSSTSEPDFTATGESLVANITTLDNLKDMTENMKNVLCAYSCEEASAAKLIEALACKLAVEKGLIGGGDSCPQCCSVKCKK